MTTAQLQIMAKAVSGFAITSLCDIPIFCEYETSLMGIMLNFVFWE